MTDFTPQNPDYEDFVRAALKRQGFMDLIGAELKAVEPGKAVLAVAYRDDLNQQNGFLHGGVVGALCDNTAAAAAGTLVAAGSGILTIEYKVNFLGPAVGDRLEVHGEVVRMGRSVTVSRADAFAFEGEKRRHVASALVSLMVTAPD
ncbi:MAG: PaaI family thioesterase [Alphaproteobacteria bacterium]|nr:PaaI family thioesterase [Alphaproteobacteria bacterium]